MSAPDRRPSVRLRPDWCQFSMQFASLPQEKAASRFEVVGKAEEPGVERPLTILPKNMKQWAV